VRVRTWGEHQVPVLDVQTHVSPNGTARHGKACHAQHVPAQARVIVNGCLSNGE